MRNALILESLLYLEKGMRYELQKNYSRRNKKEF